jgi:hypothetical protein
VSKASEVFATEECVALIGLPAVESIVEDHRRRKHASRSTGFYATFYAPPAGGDQLCAMSGAGYPTVVVCTMTEALAFYWKSFVASDRARARGQ